MSSNMVQEAQSNSPELIEVRPLTLHIGAEIDGIDLTQPLSSAAVGEIRDALLQWKVVFFRDQHIDHQQHVDFARQFGELTPGHAVYGNVEGFPEIYAVSKGRKSARYKGEMAFTPWSGWHADITAAVNPPAASILRGDIVPPYGGDTMWTNLAAAYDALSPTLRGFLDGLRAVHQFNPPPGVETSQEYEEKMRRNRLITEHPLIRVHPETGERVLYVSPSFLKSIVDVTPTESESLLALLKEHAVRPEFTVRFKWEPGSIAFWDNRSVAHLAPRDIYASDFGREFYRVTLVGDIPVGVDGQPSKSIQGDPVLAVA